MSSFQNPPGGYPRPGRQSASFGARRPGLEAARLRQLSESLVSAAGRIETISNNLAGLASQVNSMIGGAAGAEDATIRQALASTALRASKTVNAYKKTADRAGKVAPHR